VTMGGGRDSAFTYKLEAYCLFEATVLCCFCAFVCIPFVPVIRLSLLPEKLANEKTSQYGKTNIAVFQNVNSVLLQCILYMDVLASD